MPARKKPDPAPPAATSNRRDELVRVAARLFREKGFKGTTVRDIAQAADMRSGSPFYHFASKQDLLLAVIEEAVASALQRTEEAVGGAAAALPAIERFARLVRAQYGILHDHGSDANIVILLEWRSLTPEQQTAVRPLKKRYDGLWQQVIDDLHAEGRLGADPKLARRLILGAINYTTWFRPRSRAAGSVGLQEMAEQTVRLFLQPV
jgi:AcrR family transcriptional regulator